MRKALLVVFIAWLSVARASDQRSLCTKLLYQSEQVFYPRDPLHRDLQRFIDPKLSLQNFLDLIRVLKWDQVTPFHKSYVIERFAERVADLNDRESFKKFPLPAFIRFVANYFDVQWYSVLETLHQKTKEFPQDDVFFVHVLQARLTKLIERMRASNQKQWFKIRNLKYREDSQKRQDLYLSLNWILLSETDKSEFLSWAQGSNEIPDLLNFFDKYRDPRFLSVLDFFQRQQIKATEHEGLDFILKRMASISRAIVNLEPREQPVPLGRTQTRDLLASESMSIAFAIHQMALDNKIEFTDHALARMSGRGIPRSLIYEAFALGNNGVLDKVAEDYSPSKDTVIFKWSYRSTNPAYPYPLKIIFSASPLTGKLSVITAFFYTGRFKLQNPR